MPDLVCVADVYCQIRGLEPVAGAAVAINLAYLALDRFRYSSIVQDVAVSGLGDEKVHGDTRLQKTTPFKVLCLLAGEKAPATCKVAISDDEDSYGFWFWIYRSLFRKGWDEWIGFACTFWAYLVLFLGVASAVGTISGAVNFFTNWVSASFAIWSLLIVTLFPLVFVGLGRGCSTWAQNHAEKMGRELAETAKNMAENISKDTKPLEPNGIPIAASVRRPRLSSPRSGN